MVSAKYKIEAINAILKSFINHPKENKCISSVSDGLDGNGMGLGHVRLLID